MKETVRRLNLIGTFKELGTTKLRKETLMGLAATQALVQLASMPIGMVIPSIAEHFEVSVSTAAWMVIIRLLILGATVFLAARLGEKYGHVRLYFLGAVLMTVASVMAATSLTFSQLMLWSALVGLGGALITSNSNAILAITFAPNERGRAFSVPIVAARISTVFGIALFGVLLQYFDWRLVFVSYLPVGLWAIKNSVPLLKYRHEQFKDGPKEIYIDYLGAALMVATLGAFILSGVHLHEGLENFTSPDALGYHVPMHLLTLALLGLFIVIQARSKAPFVDFRHFKRKYFSMALYTNTTFHLSMLAVTTLIPIVVQNGLGQSPMVVTLVLFPGQFLGLVLPSLAGWIYDRYNPRWLRPGSLMLIALGFILIGLFAEQVPIWALPILLFPTFIGSNLFNSANNALVMNTLPENRSFASGMLETTRQMGHTVGATIAATVMGLALPLAIEVLPVAEAQMHYKVGFQYAALTVVWIMISGSIVAMFQRMPTGGVKRRTAAPGAAQPQPSGGD